MKRILLSAFTLIAICYNASAQIAAVNPTLVINGFTSDWILVANVDVYNNGNSPVDIMCQRTANVLATGHKSSFCWGTNCFGDTTNICTVPVNVVAGGHTSSFVGDLKPNQSAGTSYITYRYFESGNPSNFAEVTYQYNVGVTGINESNLKPTITAPQPNPADKFTSIAYSLKSDPSQFNVEIYNLTGAKVASYNFSNKSGLMLIATEDLQSGIYLCSLKQNGKPVSSQKLVVSHN